MTEELWTAVDGYITDLLVRPDPALDAALADSEAAGLPAISVAPSHGKLLHLLARLQATAFTHRVLRGWGFGASPARQVVGREERAMEGLRLGRFGDRRLEKGGPSFWSDWCRRPAGACACAGWAGAAPGRCV